MSPLADLQSRLNDTHAAIAQLERAIAQDPGSTTLPVSVRSLEKRAATLQAHFLEEADRLGVDVCTYRLFTNGHRQRMADVAKALLDFQRLLTVVFDAITVGPKSRAVIDADVTEQTALDFAYSFSGSVGMVMTIPNERLLLIDSHLDMAMRKVFELAKTESAETIDQIATTLGAATVRSLYRWADDHVQTGFGADIKWRRREEVRASLLIQEPELRRLTDAISVAPDTRTETLVLDGELQAADVKRRTFKLKIAGGTIRGRFGDAITAEHKAMLPQRYRAYVLKTTRMRYAMDQPEETFFLTRLEEPTQAEAL
jgi:hypothetical protein